jgi:hypothetical protein
MKTGWAVGTVDACRRLPKLSRRARGPDGHVEIPFTPLTRLAAPSDAVLFSRGSGCRRRWSRAGRGADLDSSGEQMGSFGLAATHLDLACRGEWGTRSRCVGSSRTSRS